MNVPNNDVLQAWEVLFEVIDEWRDKECDVVLDDSDEEGFDLTNAQLMSRMTQRLVQSFRDRFSSDRYRYPDTSINLGNKFFCTMSPQAQRSFFATILNFPLTHVFLGDVSDGPEKSEITIDTPAVLDALSSMDGHQLRVFSLENFALANTLQVQQLADIIVANKETFWLVGMEDIECPVHYNKRNRDGKHIGFLDPILDALSQLQTNNISGGNAITVSARIPPSSCCLVSPKSLSSFLSSTRVNYEVFLNRLGLNDTHCSAIAEHVSEHRAWACLGHCVDYFDLEKNPDITNEGCRALLHAANHTMYFPTTIHLDDERWDREINFATKLNRSYGRLDYLVDGVFPSRERWVEWLEKAATIQETSDRLSCIYYTIRENPAFLMS